MKKNKRLIITIAGAILIGVGCTLFIRYSGVNEAHDAQNEIAESGYYYNGDSYLTTQEYDELKLSLATRDCSLQTSGDLIIMSDIQDNRLHIQYSFFSTNNYSGLNKTREMPSWFNSGLWTANTAYILLMIAPAMWLLYYFNKREII